MGTEIGLFDCFLHDPMSESELILDQESDLGLSRNDDGFILDSKMDLLSTSMRENGILDGQASGSNNQDWTKFDTDAFLDSILTENDGGDTFNRLDTDDIMGGEDAFTNLVVKDEDDDFCEGRLASFDEDSLSEDGGMTSQIASPDHEMQEVRQDKSIRVQLVNSSSNNRMSTAPLLSSKKASSATSSASATTTLAAKSTSSQRPTPTVAKILTGFRSGTTILLPVLSSKSSTSLPTLKRRRISDSSSDSGNSSIDLHTDESSSAKSPRIIKSGSSVVASGKYPPLILSEEEKRICERENIKLPSHYPLSREEEKNLKRIRRKIRNKVSAQDSRRRKKEYMDNMEERVKQCTAEKEELQQRIDQLETQNKTLAGQLRRLHQIIVNGGLKQTQTSTAMMVLLLSTALFLIPGFRDQHEGQKSSEPSSQIDISRAIKMPPMPGQSRSLLQFTQIKQEFNENTPNDVETPLMKTVGNGNKVAMLANANSLKAVKEEEKEFTPITSFSATADHDYVGKLEAAEDLPAKMKKKRSYIVEDVPPEGYGYGDTIKDEEENNEIETSHEEVYFVTDEEVVISEIDSDDVVMAEDVDTYTYTQDRKLNVSVATAEGSGIRTIVLHVPKDIK